MKSKILALMLIMILMIPLYSCTRGKGKLVSVPSFVGMRIRDAEKLAEEKGLLVKVVGTEFSKEFPIDYIVTQEPNPHVLVKEGRIINVTISNGPPKVEVPDFVGMDFGDAQELIYEKRLVIGKIEEVSDPNVKVGIILEQEPSPKTLVEEGTPINLKISKGVLGQVPSVIGLSLEEAKSQVITGGYTIGKIVEKRNPAYPSGIVWNQDPAPLTYASSGSSVDLVVNP